MVCHVAYCQALLCSNSALMFQGQTWVEYTFEVTVYLWWGCTSPGCCFVPAWTCLHRQAVSSRLLAELVSCSLEAIDVYEQHPPGESWYIRNSWWWSSVGRMVGTVSLLCFLWLCFRGNSLCSCLIISKVMSADGGINLYNNPVLTVTEICLEFLGIWV